MQCNALSCECELPSDYHPIRFPHILNR
uniref:Uncharacterized protein n=1 Tax=Anguilla anguilla TaxID=7936 RepID=A0A0E9T8X5_ANGAN